MCSIGRIDTDTVEQKDQTRNLGLQSIVNREDTLVGMAVNEAADYSKALVLLNQMLDTLNSQLSVYIIIANKIYMLMTNAYHSTNKTQKLAAISNTAAEIVRKRR